MLELSVNELTDTRLDFVSLVKRGANRVPFRIVKEDQTDMLDLQKIGERLFKQASTTPIVTAALVRKGADLEAMKARLVKAGLTVDQLSEGENLHIFTQTDASPTDQGIIKMDDDLGLVVSGVTKAFRSYNFEDTSFGEILSTEGFYPSVGLARDVLTTTIYNAMEKAESPGEAATAITKAIDDFRGYVGTLLTSLPVHAFKAEGIFAPISSPAIAPDVPANDAGEPVAPDAVVEPEAPPTNAGAEGTEPVEKATPETTAAIPEPMLALVAELLEANLAELKKAIASDLETAMTGVKKDVGSLQAALGTLEGKLQKTQEVVAGTVGLEPEGDSLRLTKTATALPPLLDTAFTKLDQKAA